MQTKPDDKLTARAARLPFSRRTERYGFVFIVGNGRDLQREETSIAENLSCCIT